MPSHQTAIVATGPGKLAIIQDAPIPALAPDMVLVKTTAVAINPADAKFLDYSPSLGAIHGADFAGTVVALGADATARNTMKVGDRVAGAVHGMNNAQPDVGAFAEYVGACADLLLRIPDHMTFEEAAGLGTGVITAVLCLFSELRLPVSLDQLRNQQPTKPGVTVQQDDREFVLVAGGSTATGTRAIQLMKLAGLRPIATCSPANFDLALRFGAEKVFDYHSPTCTADIRAYTQGELAYALDCVSQADTTQLCYSSIGRAGGRYVSLEPFRDTVAQKRSLTIEPSWVMSLTIYGRKVDLEGEYGREARPHDRDLGAQAFTAIQSLLDRGLIDTHPVKRMPGRWKGVIEGVDIIRSQALSGQKMVYSVA
ncbi:MAG: hypothetical protein Q9223_001501 [Gallowayella weberi]